MFKSVPSVAYHKAAKAAWTEGTKNTIAAAVLTAYTLAAGTAAINAFNEPDFHKAAALADLNEKNIKALRGITFSGAAVQHRVAYAFPFRGDIEGVAVSTVFGSFSDSGCKQGIEVIQTTLTNGDRIWGRNNREKLLTVVSRNDGKRFCLDR